MGTTNRRQPVSFNIPKAPDYKFLNITNFRGLDVSSNPFELASNTASDCLNVYVDETNTLTTRPRLEKKISTPLDGEHISTYNLHNGYLFHYNKYNREEGQITGTTPTLWLYQDGTLNTNPVSGENIPTNKCTYFEDGDKIYLLDGERYMVIADNKLEDVEGYVPLTEVVKSNGVSETVAPKNLLTDKIKRAYYWDTKYSAHLPDLKNVISYKNTHLKQIGYRSDVVELLQIYDDYSAITWDGYRYYYIDNYLDTDSSPTEIFRFYSDYSYHCTTRDANNKQLFVFDGIDMLLYIYKYNGGMWEAETRPLPDGQFLIRGAVLNSTVNAEYIWMQRQSTNTGNVFKWDAASQKYNNLYQTGRYVKFSGVSRLIEANVVYGTDGFQTGDLNVTRNIGDVSTKQTLLTNATYSNATISKEGNVVCWVDGDNTLRVFLDNGTSFEQYSTTKLPYFVNYCVIQESAKTIWAVCNDFSTNALYLYCLNNYGIDGAVFTFYKPKAALYDVIDNIFVFSQYIIQYDALGRIEVETKVEFTSDELEKRRLFYKSLLTTRFDNNYWFAVNNRYYRSAENNPTYFPTTEYHDLGDSNEDITGFNLANDTTLIAYKKNRLYLIQPYTSALNTTEYMITESKNTVGNTAVGAPIVTSLTEIPLQINNDGIYGLSQLSNVSATERVADLMSEPINERWLSVDDNIILNAQTLNRLYWTYIILPNEKEHNTMIYLLDNRTNSWYYWELPIVVANSFVKDNRAEFVDSSGNIYYLTTTDIRNINHSDEYVTEYYDDGRRLIPWHWQSQILPLGTMNYSKRLVNTTFILTDTDDNDGYGMQYSFRVFRKLASSTPEKEMSDKLTLVRSTTKKTNISKFGFLQIRLSNFTQQSRDYEAFENNKLRLVGLGLKYVLLEGLIR